MSKIYVQTLDLENDPGLIEFYLNAHHPENIWPEIPAGIREVGITGMKIFRLGTRMVMLVETPDNFDFPAQMARLAGLPRQQEWEEYVGKAQKCDKNAPSAGKWQLMDPIFNLDDC